MWHEYFTCDGCGERLERDALGHAQFALPGDKCEHGWHVCRACILKIARSFPPLARYIDDCDAVPIEPS